MLQTLMLTWSKAARLCLVIFLLLSTHVSELSISSGDSAVVCVLMVVSRLCACAVLRVQSFSVAAKREASFSMTVPTVGSQPLLSTIESSMVSLEVFICT